MVLKNRVMMIYPFIIHGSTMEIHCWGASLLKNDFCENCWPLSDSQSCADLPWFFYLHCFAAGKLPWILQESNAMGQKNPFVVALAFTEQKSSEFTSRLTEPKICKTEEIFMWCFPSTSARNGWKLTAGTTASVLLFLAICFWVQKCHPIVS